MWCVCVGKVVSGLHYTPCGRYVVYPLGSFIVLKNLVNEREAFFDGHSQDVSCIAMSHNGDRLASGQVNFTGVKVSVDGSGRAALCGAMLWQWSDGCCVWVYRRT